MRLYEVATKLTRAEEDFRATYLAAGKLAIAGALPENVRTLVHHRRDASFAAEMNFRSELIAALQMLPAQQALIDQVTTAIPHPIRFPDLPRAGQAIPAFPRYESPALRGLGTPLALAAPPVWVAIVVTIIAATAFVALGVWLIEATVGLAARVTEEFELTRRYRSQLEAVNSRYQDCVAQGGAPTECGAVNPVPDLPVATREEEGGFRDLLGGSLGTVIKVGGILLAAGLGFWALGHLPKGRGGGGVSALRPSNDPPDF